MRFCSRSTRHCNLFSFFFSENYVSIHFNFMPTFRISQEKEVFQSFENSLLRKQQRHTLNRRATCHKMCISLPEFPTSVHFLDFAMYVNPLTIGRQWRDILVNISLILPPPARSFSVARVSFILIIFFHKNNYHITSDIDLRNLIIFLKYYTLVRV